MLLLVVSSEGFLSFSVYTPQLFSFLFILHSKTNLDGCLS
ncbi:hypothetical protein PORCAN_1249 [Porphyromonas crevioricanis JCM 13913]|nr:hypothetical protein PORCAN_1249 [Porphyromonas crevioricanis JCM 13913]